MKQNKVTRLLSCKIHCPFNCFFKYFYNQDSLKLKNNTHPVPYSGVVVSGIRYGSEVKDGIRSCIRKSSGSEEIEKKKRVQWVDNIGQELAQIKEFESSETGETEHEEENKNCVNCFIL